MRTENFSSAATTTSTIDSESTSRSSVNDLSSCTSSAGMPVTSLTISASSLRISSVVAMVAGFLSLVGAGVGCRVGTSCGLGTDLSGDADDLGGVRQPGAEGDQERQVTGLGL